MNYIRLFNKVMEALLESGDGTLGRVIAVTTFQAIIAGDDINDEMALETLRFFKRKLGDHEMHQLLEYFANVHDINYSMGEI